MFNLFDVDNLRELAMANYSPDDGDTIDDAGMIICGKCGTPKTCRGHGVFEGALLPIECKCEHDANERKRIQREKADKQRHIEHLRAIAFPNRGYLSMTFERDMFPESSASMLCRKYARNWKQNMRDNVGLLLYGSVGTGKSYYAACIANELINQGVHVEVTTFPRIIRTMQGFDVKDRAIDQLMQPSLLILDDLGAERDTSYGQEQVFAVIDARLLSRKPVIVTTNLTFSELRSPSNIGLARIYDRVIEMCPLQIECNGESKRERISREKGMQAIRGMIGGGNE